jgi:competence protein ComEC
MVELGRARTWPLRRSPQTVPFGLIAALARNLEGEQERWFLWLPVAFGTGIAAYFLLPWEPSTLAAMLPVGAALALHLAGSRSGVGALFTAALLAVSVGVAIAKLRTEFMRAPVLEQRIGPIEVRGVIELVEPRATGGQRLTLQVSQLASLPPEARPYRIRVRTSGASLELKPGDAVRLKAILSPPPGPTLPGDYDFARVAWFQALGAVGFAQEAVQIDRDAAAPPLPLRFSAAVARLRQTIGQRIVAALPGQTGAIANALITGERGGISDAVNQAFRDSGLFHILSISGLHMVIMAGSVFFSVRVALAAIPAIALRYPIKKWAAAGAMAGALGYLLISGASVATVRSYVMISIMFIAVLLDRPAVALRNVALAALAILLLWPESLLDPGFQMSFAAVVALVAVYERISRRQEQQVGAVRRSAFTYVLLFFAGIVLSTLVASLAVAPFGIYHFHNTQQFAILANLLAIPICNLLVMPAALATLLAMPFGFEAGPLKVMGLGIDAMVWCAKATAALPGAVGRIPAIPTLAFALVIIGGLWCALWATRWRLLGVVAIVAGLIVAPTAPRPDVLIGRGAGLVAVRDEKGRLSALSKAAATFELGRWLEHDGDTRPVREAAAAQAFSCDSQGCIARVKGALVAVASSPMALRDDCAAAAILVVTFPPPRNCAPAGVLVTPDKLETLGTHALYIEPGGAIRLETVADARGNRPWSQHRSAPRLEAASPPALVEEDKPTRREQPR